jgi:hypothetical protein
MAIKKPKKRSDTKSLIWIPKDLNRMAKVIATIRGESIADVLDRAARPLVAKEYAQLVKPEAK